MCSKMPSNAQTKTSGSKNQTKPSGTKNVSKAAGTKEIEASALPPDVMKPLESAKPNQLAGKAAPRIASPGPAQSTNNTTEEPLDDTHGTSGVNKKKQKRRQKEAARKAAEQHAMTGSQLAQEFANVADSAYQDIVKEMAAAQARGEANGYDYGGSDYDDPEQYEPDDGEDVSWEYTSNYAPPRTNGHALHNHASTEIPGGKAKKKKRAKSGSNPNPDYSAANHMPPSNPTSFQPPPPPPPPPLGQALPSGTHRSAQNASKDRIWNTSTAEERERIKEFWLSLGEEDRRSLVKVEKEAVLKKMKEQQKHSCSCTVCGRKRTAIEEELEVLYDAYYEELEQYANNQQILGEDGTMMAPPQFHHPLSRAPPNRHPQMLNGRSSRGRIQEIGDDEEAVEEDDYSDEEEDDEISEDDDGEEQAGPSTEFFNFGENLTVQDDLLKNDGKKFIEMMEQLAERRMQREEEAQYAAAGMGHASMQGHNHGPPLDDDGYDDDEDDEYDSQEYDEDDEEDDMGSMSEKDRMKEGRRMFQIFAARMFEQRVLTAYREKVALERQQKLLEELDDESRVDAQREAKKAKEAQKKKDKKRQQKQAKDEEKAKRDAEKAAEEAAAKALEEKKAEELRQRKEEQRRKKEAEKKAQEEEKQRKEVEKQKRVQEAKEQQAEQERKQREQKEREKKKREEVKKKEREERELKEKEAREKKERDARAKSEAEAKTLNRKYESAAKQSMQMAQSIPKRPSPANGPSIAGSVPPGLHQPLTTSSHASPHLQIATPVVPKAPTPMRQRQSSFQESRNNSPKTSLPTSSSSTTSPGVSAEPNGTLTGSGKVAIQPILTQQSQLSSHYSPIGTPSGQVSQPPGLSSMPSMVANAFPSSTFGPPLSPMTQQASHHSAMYSNQAAVGSNQYRNFIAPNGMSFPPGINGSRQMPQGRGGMMDPPPSQISPIGLPSVGSNDVSRYRLSRDNIPSHTHSRNTSASFDRSSFETPTTPAQAQPIARPAPIKRPSSVAPHQQGGNVMPIITDVDDLSNHLGSSALLDDTDVPMTSNPNDSRRGSMAPGAPRSVRQGFGINSGFSDPIGTTRLDNLPRGMQNGNGNTWSAQQSPFGGPPMSGPPLWSNPPGFSRPSNSNAFGSIGSASRANPSRAATIRLAVRTACEKMDSRPLNGQGTGWLRAEDLLHEVQLMKPAHEAPNNSLEMLEICDMPGNIHNGDGSFTRLQDPSGWIVRYEPGRNSTMGGSGRALDIGSPIVGGAMPTIGGQRLFQQPGAF